MEDFLNRHFTPSEIKRGLYITETGEKTEQGNMKYCIRKYDTYAFVIL